MDTSYPREDIFTSHPNKPDSSHTAVNIGVPPAPRDHLLWSVCNTVYLNLFCLGFMALVYSVKLTCGQLCYYLPKDSTVFRTPDQTELPLSRNRANDFTGSPGSSGGRFTPLYNARDQKVQGDERAARLYGRKARCYNILATIWNVTLPALLLALFITGIVHLSQVVNASIDLFNLQSYMGSTEDENK